MRKNTDSSSVVGPASFVRKASIRDLTNSILLCKDGYFADYNDNLWDGESAMSRAGVPKKSSAGFAKTEVLVAPPFSELAGCCGFYVLSEFGDKPSQFRALERKEQAALMRAASIRLFSDTGCGGVICTLLVDHQAGWVDVVKLAGFKPTLHIPTTNGQHKNSKRQLQLFVFTKEMAVALGHTIPKIKDIDSAQSESWQAHQDLIDAIDFGHDTESA